MLDAKDSAISLGDFVEIESKQNQNYDGSPLAILMQVIKRLERQTGTTWAFTARQFAFGGATFVNPVIYIDGSYPDELFDLNLKSAHDRRYDPASLTAGSIVEFIITSGILVSGSTTSTYALTNPNTWPIGVFVRLVIESGAIVAGRGGNGGNGSVFGDGSGGSGGNGGKAFNIQYAVSVLNNGIISIVTGKQIGRAHV